MAKSVEDTKKLLRGKKRKETGPDWERGLSTGLTLLNLACSGRVDVGLLPSHFYLLVGDSRAGKAQPLDCNVLTPKGWKRMGDLVVGDVIVDPDGGTAHVEDVYPQGKLDVFRVSFSDGSYTDCCRNHLWMVEDNNNRRRGTHKILTTDGIREWIKKGGRNSALYVPVTKPVEFERKELSIAPYLMGVLLGNGHFGKNTVTLSTYEDEIKERVEKLLPENHWVSERRKGCYVLCYKKGHPNAVLDASRKYKLDGKKADKKFIPRDYLFSCLEDRIELLRGLIDTDGYVTTNNSIEYSSASEELIEDIRQLVWSLGGAVTYRVKRNPKYTYKGEVRHGLPSHTLTITLPRDIIPAYLKRKVERIRPKKNSVTRRIVSVKKRAPEECQCIRVSSKRRLYITDDFLVTHNTFLMRQLMAEVANNPNYKDYRIIDDNPERGTLFDTRKFFGTRLADRMEPPTPKGSSTLLEEFYDNVDDAIKDGRPFFYGLDSEDALTPYAAVKKAQQDKNVRRKTKGKDDGEEKMKGSYGTEKPKINSSSLNRVHGQLEKSSSILVMIKQSRDNIGPGAMFDPKTRSGGHALTFYATLELWFSVVRKIRRTVMGKPRTVGTMLKIQIKKNRMSGDDKAVFVPFYRSSGFDDVGSMVNFLCDEGHWDSNLTRTKDATRVEAKEFDYDGSPEKLIQKIEKEGLENELKMIVADVWSAIEEGSKVVRKQRYQ